MIDGLLLDYQDVAAFKNTPMWISAQGYVTISVNGIVKGKPRSVPKSLHTVIMIAPKGMVVDHINRNKLDNRRSNLRIVTQGDNVRNSARYKGGTIWYVPDSPRRRARWKVQISLGDCTKKSVGSFKTLAEAEAALESAKVKL